MRDSCQSLKFLPLRTGIAFAMESACFKISWPWFSVAAWPDMFGSDELLAKFGSDELPLFEALVVEGIHFRLVTC